MKYYRFGYTQSEDSIPSLESVTPTESTPSIEDTKFSLERTKAPRILKNKSSKFFRTFKARINNKYLRLKQWKLSRSEYTPHFLEKLHLVSNKIITIRAKIRTKIWQWLHIRKFDQDCPNDKN